MITAATSQKRQQLRLFIEREVKPDPAVQGMIVIGSVGSGQARPDSDIDAIVFLNPDNPYAVPAECLWCPADSSYHSIFSESPDLEACVQFDFTRLDLSRWADPGYVWPEARRAELASGWIAFDRSEWIGDLIAARTLYPNGLRESRLDESITWLDQHLSDDRPWIRWESLGPAIAHDRLNAAYTHLVQALFAYHRRWRPWRNLEMTALLDLPWLPEDFETRYLDAMHATSLDDEGYTARVEALRGLFRDLLNHLVKNGEYDEAPIREAFIRSHDEPGRSWNMEEWKAGHRSRKAEWSS